MKPLAALFCLVLLNSAIAQEPQPDQHQFDLLLRGGHVIDPKNQTNGIYDVAIRDGKVAAVEQAIDPALALKSVDVSGFYVTPGLIDIHVHVFVGAEEFEAYVGRNTIHPDAFSLRSGVTTVADAGCAGWRNFEQFKERVIDRARTRVLVFLNIVGHGMRGGRYENDIEDMQPSLAAEMAGRYKDVIVGIKTAHYSGPDFTAVDRAVEAGELANLPVMVDFGRATEEKSVEALLTKKLRPGDIYTHVFSGIRGELTPDGKPNPGLIEGRKRGVILDVGHGGSSFAWRVAVPILNAGIAPDTISTDLHLTSMNDGMKDMLTCMNKFLAMGMSLDDVILRSTWNAAHAIRREELGHLSVGAPADVAVLRLEEGRFGFLDAHEARLDGTQRLTCEMTLRDGRIVYELNGLARPEWTTLPEGYRSTGDRRWDGFFRGLRGRRPRGPEAGDGQRDRETPRRQTQAREN